VHVITRRKLQEFWERPGCGDAEQPLKAWFAEASAAKWRSPNDIKSRYRSASFVADRRVIFNICGNKYRLIVHVNYEIGVVLVKFIGTHAEYDEIDAATVGRGASR
jgi:mRNA interferase HigB